MFKITDKCTSITSGLLMFASLLVIISIVMQMKLKADAELGMPLWLPSALMVLASAILGGAWLCVLKGIDNENS